MKYEMRAFPRREDCGLDGRSGRTIERNACAGHKTVRKFVDIHGIENENCGTEK